MGAVIKKAFRQLLPMAAGRNFKAVMDAFSKPLENLKDFLSAVIEEANPETAEETLDLWMENEGVAQWQNFENSEKKATVLRSFYSYGAQNIEYLNRQIKTVFPGVTILEKPIKGDYNPYHYGITGHVPPERINGLLGILQRIVPAIYQPVIEMGPLFDDEGFLLKDDDQNELTNDNGDGNET